MARSHINPETGEAGRCSAKWGCPFKRKGDELGIVTHFDSIKEARTAGEKIQEKLYGTFATIGDKKTNLKEIMASLIDENSKFSKKELMSIADLKDDTITVLLAKRPEVLKADKDLTVLQKIIDQNNIEAIEFLSKSEELSEKSSQKILDYALNNKNETIINNLLRNDDADLSTQGLAQVIELCGRDENNYTNRTLARNIFRNPNLNTELLNKLLKKSPWLKDNPVDLARHSASSVELISELVLDSRPDDTIVRNKATDHPNCPPQLKKELMDLRNMNDIATYGKDPQQIDDVLNADYAKLFPTAVKNNWIETRVLLRQNALRNQNLSAETTLNILKNGTPEEKELIIKSSGGIKSREQHEIMQEILKENQNIADNDPDVMEQRKAKEKIRKVQEKLSKSTYAKPQELQELAEKMLKNGEIWQLNEICSNPETPPAVLKVLSKQVGGQKLKERIAENPNTPQDVLIRLSKLKSPDTLTALARNKKLSQEVQLRLAEAKLNAGEERWVLRNLLGNPTINAETIDVIAKRPDLNRMGWRMNFDYIKEIKKHPKTSMKTLLMLAENYPDAEEDEEE